MGKDISGFTNLLASVQRFHTVLNNPGIKNLLRYKAVPSKKNVGTASFLTSFQLLSVVLWGLLERSITEIPIKNFFKKFKRKEKKKENKTTTIEKQFRKKLFISMAIESITKGSTVLLEKEANEVPLSEQTELTKQ